MSIELPPRGSRGSQPPSGGLRRLLQPVLALNVALVPLLGDRIRPNGGHLCVLRTLGARSGLPRRTPLLCFDAPGGGWLIIASYGGAAANPQWLRNIAKRPDAVWLRIGRQETRVRAETLQGAARDEAWQRIVAQSRNYAGYQTKTDRVIPLVRLTPAAAGTS